MRHRDPDRSRRQILVAAEVLFAERGFNGVTLGEVGAKAGLSRGTPSYFFGSKDGLYHAVLERVFRDREEATRRAFRPLMDWVAAPEPEPLRDPLSAAVGGYLEFLSKRPSFFKLIQREELSAAIHLHGAQRESKAIEEAFAAVRGVAPRHGVTAFETKDAVLLFVSLTYFPLSHGFTFMSSLDRDLADAKVRRRHIGLVVEQLLFLLGGRS